MPPIPSRLFPNPSLLLALGLVLSTTAARALEVSDWKSRQTLAVDRTGAIKLALPPATLDLARPGLEDLRLLDPAGREIPFVIEQPAPVQPAVTREPKSVHTNLTNAATQLVIETGSGTTPFDTVTLLTPAPNFIKSARVEISADGRQWETIRSGALVFRQFGAEQLAVALEGRPAAQVRVTLDDARSEPIPFTGATLRLSAASPPPATAPLPVELLRRDEFASETVLTLDLGARNVPLAALEIRTTEPLFARRVSVAVRELRDDAMVERVLAGGPMWRVATEGLPPSAQLELPLDFRASSRELFVHLDNGDSPPIAITEVRMRQRPLWLEFRAGEAGTYTLLSGNNQVAAPRYDLAALAPALREAQPITVTPGPAEPNPGYRRPDPLADAPLLGAALDPAPWHYRKTVGLTAGGVQEMELDLDALAHARPGFGDLRLVREGTQVPYLIERAALSRSLPLAPVPASDIKPPTLSRWEIKLPHAGLPLNRLTLRSSSILFQRRVRLFEKIPDGRDGTVERTLAEADWSHTPGHDPALVLWFNGVPTTDTLTIETANGDNPPLLLTGVQATYPVVRLLFKTEPGPLSFYYGNPDASPPRYDLSLVAGQILAAEKSVATLGAEEKARSDGWSAPWLSGLRGGPILWIALGLVVVVLLVVVAKLLPKPPAPVG
jgi:hypothetical protein